MPLSVCPARPCPDSHRAKAAASLGTMNSRSSHLSEEIQDYIAAHSTRQDEVLAGLAAETARRFPGPSGMQIGPDQGALLTMLARMVGAASAVEVGTFTGYSAICIARGL